jgi:hypothetical protein
MAKLTMAKAKSKKAQQRPAPPPDDDDDDLVPDVTPPSNASELEEDAEAELSAALVELGGISGATVTVNRVNEQGKEELCDRYPAREFDLFSIRERFGPGTYWIYGRDGKQLYKKGRVIFSQTVDELRGRRGASASSAAPAADPLASMREMYDRQAQRDRDMMQMFLQAMSGNRSGPSDIQAVFDMASKLASLNKRESSDPIEQLLRLRKLEKELGGDGGGDSSALVELGRAFLDKLPAPASTAGNDQAPAAGDQSNMLSMMIRRALAARLPMLIAGAQRDTDAGVYAQLVLDQVPEIYLGPLLEQLQKPDWFNLLVQIDGRVVPLQAWFEQLRAAILEATQGPPPPAA